MRTAEDIVLEKGVKIISVAHDTIVIEALRLMVANKIGGVVVKKGEDVIGIWTERDLMRSTLEEGFDARKTQVGANMSEGIKACPHTSNIYDMMDMLLGLRKRHLLIEKEGEYIGLLSAGDVMRACLQRKTQELKDVHAIASWEYYEEWDFGSREQPKP